MKATARDYNFHSEMKMLAHAWALTDMVKNGIIHPPATLSIDMSNLCNHSCQWCIFGNYIAVDKTIMSKEIMDILLKDLAKMHTIKAVCLSGGGEPTVNKHSDWFMNQLVSIGKQVSLNTHGGLLHTKDPNILLSLTYIRVSLDSNEGRLYFEQHRPGGKREDEFATVLQNIANLCDLKRSGAIKSNTVIGIGYLMNKENSKNLYEFAAYLRDMIGVDYIQFRPLKDPQNFYAVKEQFLEQFDKLQTLNNDKFKVWTTVDKMEEAIVNPEAFSTFDKCFVAPLIGNIGPQGDVRVCPELRDHTGSRGYLGNVKEKPLSEIWGSQAHKDHLAQMDFTKCPMCKYRSTNELIQKIIIDDSMHMNFI